LRNRRNQFFGRSSRKSPNVTRCTGDVRRDDKGRFDEVDDMGRSLSQDRKRKAKTVVKAGRDDKATKCAASG